MGSITNTSSNQGYIEITNKRKPRTITLVILANGDDCTKAFLMLLFSRETIRLINAG